MARYRREGEGLQSAATPKIKKTTLAGTGDSSSRQFIERARVRDDDDDNDNDASSLSVWAVPGIGEGVGGEAW